MEHRKNAVEKYLLFGIERDFRIPRETRSCFTLYPMTDVYTCIYIYTLLSLKCRTWCPQCIAWRQIPLEVRQQLLRARVDARFKKNMAQLTEKLGSHIRADPERCFRIEKVWVTWWLMMIYDSMITKAAFAAGVSSALAGKEGTGVGREWRDFSRK